MLKSFAKFIITLIEPVSKKSNFQIKQIFNKTFNTDFDDEEFNFSRGILSDSSESPETVAEASVSAALPEKRLRRDSSGSGSAGYHKVLNKKKNKKK